MNAKKAKKLRRLAAAYIADTGKPIGALDKAIKQVKQAYKKSKKHI